jgi:vitamin B12 transporter
MPKLEESMKITIIAQSIASLLAGPFALAQYEVPTETLVVTANRTVQEQFDVLAAVQVFDRDAIEQIQPISLADLLSRVAGISTTTSGSAGNTTSMFVRGGNSDHVLVLVDGVRIGSATLGLKNSGNIPMQMIERVEVVRGPRAALWGSDAIGGVIQIFTRKLAQGEGRVGAELGSDNLWRAHGAIGFGNTEHQYTLAASATKSEGFDVINPDPNGETDKDGYDRQSLSLNGRSQVTEDFVVGLSAQLDEGNTEFDSGFGGNEADFKNHFMQLNGTMNVGEGIVKMSVANSVDNSVDNADKRAPGSTAGFFKTSRDQVSILGSLPLNEQATVTLGYDWYDEKVNSHRAYGETERDANAFYAVARYDVAQLKLEGSVRRDEIGETDAETTTQFAIGYQITDDVLLSYSQGSAFKAPTFNDLYWPEAFGSKGNSSLKSELADNKEVLLRVRGDNFGIELSWYETDYQNLIEWGFNAANGFFEPSNVDQAKIQGGEITFSLNVDNINNRLSLAHVDAKNKATGMQLIRRPHFTVFYELLYQGNNWDVALELNHQGKRNDIGGQLRAYTLTNVSFSYEVSENIQVRAKVNNLTNKDYIQAAAWPGPNEAAYPGADRGYSLALDYQF